MKSFIHFVFLSLSLLFVAPYLMAADTTPAPSDSVVVEYVVVNATITPLREEPSEAAEQATQLLFGQECQVIERRSSWIKVLNLTDGQQGWVSRSMLTTVAAPTATTPDSPIAVIVTPMAIVTPLDGAAPLVLTLGTQLPLYADGLFQVLGKQYSIDPACVKIRQRGQATSAQLREELIAMAKSLLNTPYLWGGKNMMGLDCSGFSQVLYSAIGINILRNAREQATQGETVTSLSDVLPGDLAFFDHADRNPNSTRITHVGVMLSPTEIIHCSDGRVHIDKIDANGIYTASGYRTHHLAKIKRYL